MGCHRRPIPKITFLLFLGLTRARSGSLPIGRKWTWSNRDWGQDKGGSNMVTHFCTRKDKGTLSSKILCGLDTSDDFEESQIWPKDAQRIVCHIWTAENTNGIHMGNPVNATQRLSLAIVYSIARKLSFFYLEFLRMRRNKKRHIVKWGGGMETVRRRTNTFGSPAINILHNIKMTSKRCTSITNHAYEISSVWHPKNEICMPVHYDGYDYVSVALRVCE